MIPFGVPFTAFLRDLRGLLFQNFFEQKAAKITKEEEVCRLRFQIWWEIAGLEMRPDLRLRPVRGLTQSGSPISVAQNGPLLSSPPPSPARPSLAQRLSRRATDLIAIGIVAAGVLAVSGQLAQWWATDADELLDPARTAGEVVGAQRSWGAGETPVVVRLGKLPLSMQRQVVVGDEDRAAAVVLGNVRRKLAAVSSSARASSSPPIDAATERELLATLKGLAPTEEQAGHWKLYRIDQPGSFVVGSLVLGVRVLADSATDEIVCWAMAVPNSDAAWTVFTFEKSAAPGLTTSVIPLPPGAETVLALTDPSGGELTSFEATIVGDVNAVLTDWRAFFSTAFSQRGWQTVRHWEQSPTGWSARFERRDATGHSAVELLLMLDQGGHAIGMANVLVP